MANVGSHISDTTVENVLKAHGIEPAPKRQQSMAWSTFLKAHWDSLFATDFTTVEVWMNAGLVTYCVMAVMHLKTRRVQIAGITPNPNAGWMQQTCRQLTDAVDGFSNGASHLIVDRDGSFLALREFISNHTETDCPASSSKSEFERLHGTLVQKSKIRMSRPHDFLWASFARASDPPIR